MITLNNEDCLETLKKLEDNTIDLCLTDLPYGILKSKKKEANFNNENRNFCDWDEEINYDEVLPHLKRVMKKDGNVLLFAKSPFTFRLYEQMTKHGFTFRYNWIWKKNICPNFAAMKYRPGCNYEEVMVFSPTPKKGKYFAHADFNGEVKVECNFYNYEKRTPLNSEEVFDNYLIPYLKLKEIFNKDIRISTNRSHKSYSSNASVTRMKFDQIFKEKYRDQFEIDFENKILYRTIKTYKNFPTSIIDIKYKNDTCKKYKKHPTTKPVEVLEFLLHHYTEENDLVLDMTAGSGSTAVACKKMNRNFVGSEISKVWFDVAQQRINDI